MAVTSILRSQKLTTAMLIGCCTSVILSLYICITSLDKTSQLRHRCGIYCNRYMCQPPVWFGYIHDIGHMSMSPNATCKSCKKGIGPRKSKHKLIYPNLNIKTHPNLTSNSVKPKRCHPLLSSTKNHRPQGQAKLHLRPNHCLSFDATERPRLIALVNSRYEWAANRILARQTWANPSWYKVTKTRVFFLLARPIPTNSLGEVEVEWWDKRNGPRLAGNPKSEDMQQLYQQQIDKESQDNGDIIQVDMPENYHTMSDKVLAGLEWINDNCAGFDYIFKTDDDMFINIFNISMHFLHIRRSHLWPFKIINPDTNTTKNIKLERVLDKIIFCSFATDAKPVRNQTNKYYVSHEEYPQNKFPQFCRGSMYFLTPDMICRILQNAPYAQPIWLEDVFMTGSIPAAIGKVQFVDLNSHGEYIQSLVTPKISLRRGLWFGHQPLVNERLRVWRSLLERISMLVADQITSRINIGEDPNIPRGQKHILP